MFSQTAEYALRATVFLALRAPGAQTAQQISSQCRIPIDYLFKVLQPLSRAGLILAQRGKHGGFSLAKDASLISMHDVLKAVEPIRRIHECPLGLKEHGLRLCRVHKKLDDAMRLIEETLEGTPISELIEDRSGPQPLCARPEIIPVRPIHVIP